VEFAPSDILTILILVVLEGLLSGDNALVLAVLVLPLPEHQRRKALQYGIIGAFVLRVIATFLAVLLTKVTWISLVGGLYLLYLPYKHFREHPDESPSSATTAAAGVLGLSLFWTIVIKADLVDLVFAVDSILAAVALSRKTWVIITGGLLGILMMRLLTLQVLALVQRYPKLIDGAYIVVAWVGVKLVWEYLHHVHLVPVELPQHIAIGIALALFAACTWYAIGHQKASAGLESAIHGAEKLFAEGEQIVVPRSADAPPPADAPDAGAGPAGAPEPP